MSSAPPSSSKFPTNVLLPTPKFPPLPPPRTVLLTPPLSAWLELERRSGLRPPLLSPPSPLSGLPPVPPSFPPPHVPTSNTTQPDPDTVRCTQKHDANVARLRSATDAEARRGTKRQIAERQRGPSWTHSDANTFIHTHMNRPRLPGEAPAVTPPMGAHLFNPSASALSAATPLPAPDPAYRADTVRPSKSARLHPTLPPAQRRYHNPAFAPPRSRHPPTPEELQELDLPSNTSSPCSSPSTSPARYDTKLGGYAKTDEHGNDLV